VTPVLLVARALAPVLAPVEPDAEEARDRLARELADPAYRAAEPSWFDRLVADVLEWLGDLFDSGPGAPPQVLLVVVVLLVVGLLVAAYFIYGAPRANRRSRAAEPLFGDDDARDAAALRAAARTAADAGDHALAVQEMFRAIARSLSERAVLTASPGTTATGFAGRAADYFPDRRDELRAAAEAFDDVRYLGGEGSEPAWRRVAELDRDISAARPRFEDAPGERVGA